MILIISTCREKLSELEFVKPIESIVKNCKIRHCRNLTPDDIKTADKIIITGTALKDFDYLKQDFSWLKEIKKPVLGICAGMQIIAKVFGFPLEDFMMIGKHPAEVAVENKLVNGDFFAYFLHTKTGFGNFKVLAESNEKPCLIRHPEKEIYACSFHPEVLNPEILERFSA